MPVLEREHVLDQLENYLDLAGDGSGSFVFLDGEAGAGKSTIARELASRVGDSALHLMGQCDPLTTPRPFGPILDIASEPATGMGDLTELREPYEIFAAVLDRLGHGLRPILMVLEDIHWADAATLDMLIYLGRRIEKTKALVLTTYRGDELGPRHPLRPVIGDLITKPGVHRHQVEMLTPAAIQTLVEASHRNVDASAIHRVTGGNAFYVTELLATEGEIPSTVQEAVLARVGGLDADARLAVEAVSTAPRAMEQALITALVGTEAEATERAVHAGVLVGDENGYRFRHELARLAVEDSIPMPRRVDYHRAVLGALPPDADGSTRAHHAVKSRDKDLIVEFVPVAAREARRRQSHHEAVQLLAAAHPYIGAMTPRERFEFLGDFQFALYAIDRQSEALRIAEELLDVAESIGDDALRGEAHRAMSRAVWMVGNRDESNRHIERAVELLEPLGPSKTLALALITLAHNRMLDRIRQAGLVAARRAVEMTEDLQLPEEHANAILTLGTLELVTGDPDEGIRLLERSIELAIATGAPRLEHVALGMLGTGGGEVKLYDRAVEWLDRGIELGRAQDEDYGIAYFTSWKARIRCEQGRWDEAVTLAEQVAKYDPSVARISPVTALGALGRVRVRRGEPGAEEALAQALDMGRDGALQHIWASMCAIAEHHWLRNEMGKAREVLSEPYRRVLQTDTLWGRGEIAYWLWMCDGLAEPPERVARPYAAMIARRWEEAADEWARIGCPYEEALALAQGDSAARVRALQIFDDLGARPAASWLRSLLREAGVESIPRGPRKTTRENPAGLTARQAQVYRLVAEGLSNADIAERLFISQKTAEHHVSAIFAKLGVASRAEAIARASNIGV